mgnify:FL=1
MNKRVRELREALGKSQEEFARSLDLSRNFINQIENGKKNLSARSIKSLCVLYDVNETWLRTGTGDMFIEKTLNERISEMMAEIQLSDDKSFKYRLVAALSEFTDEDWDDLERLLNKLSRN